MKKHGDYFLPAQRFDPQQLDSFLETNKDVDTIWLYAEPTELTQICLKHGFKLILTRRIAVLDLTLSLDDLYRNLNKKRRNGIRYAIKNGVVIQQATLEDIEEFKNVWIEGFCKKYGIEIESADRRIRSWIATNSLFIAKIDGDKKIIAGTMVRSSAYRQPKEVLIYSGNASLKEFRKYKPNDLLIWEITKWAKRNSYNEFCLAGGNLFKKEFTNSKLVAVDEWHRE